MKKPKLKERLENAAEAFFDNEKLDENTSLEYMPHDAASITGETAFFSENASQIFTILRQLFLFLPASFLLFLASVGLTARFISVYGEEGVVTVSLIQLILLLGIAMTTILGLGDLRNPKHLLIPLSLFSIGSVLGIIGTFLSEFVGFGFLFNFAPYFFPLALIASFLVKKWIDNSQSDAQARA